jgi:DNA-binding response OmpR family regulator
MWASRSHEVVDDKRQSAASVLVVDDEPILRETISYNLTRDGFDVVLAADGQEALELARTTNPDVIVLDIMLPRVDGLQVLRTLREESTVPIILLSAKGDEIDRVLGLELGADDYLAKPFAMRELVARVRAIVRRTRMTIDEPAGAHIETTRQLLKSGSLAIDVLARRATLNDNALELKPKEFDLLVYLALHPGVVISRTALLREVWGYDFPVDTRTIDVHVRGVRQKLEADASQPPLIETVRGYGYRFAGQVTRG